MIYIANSFSLGMLDDWRLTDHESSTGLTISPISNPSAYLQEAEDRHGVAISAVGHADTAALFSNILDRTVPCNRISLKLGEEDELLVGQYSGPRLPEGTWELPEGAKINWVLIFID